MKLHVASVLLEHKVNHLDKAADTFKKSLTGYTI